MKDEGRNGHESKKLCEVLRDGLCVQELVRQLRGDERELVEQVLKKIHTERIKEAPDERDIMQLVAATYQLSDTLKRALKHLLEHDSSYLDSLIWLAKNQHDWMELPAPSDS